MEMEASVAAGWPGRREHRNGGGRFRAEIEMDRGCSAISKGPGFGFAAAVREPLVRLQRPKYDFERWDWDYFAWPHDRLDANLEMRDSDPDATLEADRKASESFLNQCTPQLERYAMDQHTQEQHAAARPHNQLDVNLELRNSDPEATLAVDQKAGESFLNLSTLQLERYAMDQHTQEKHVAALPRNQLEVNLDLRNSDPEITLATDQKVCERCEMDQDEHTQEQHKEQEKEDAELRTSLLVYGKPVGRRAPRRRRRGCAEANRILGHGRAMQGPLAC